MAVHTASGPRPQVRAQVPHRSGLNQTLLQFALSGRGIVLPGNGLLIVEYPILPPPTACVCVCAPGLC